MRMYTFLGEKSRTARGARTGSPGRWRTAGTASSEADAGLSQRVAWTVSIASRFQRSARPGGLALDDPVIQRDKADGVAQPLAHPHSRLPPGFGDNTKVPHAFSTTKNEFAKFKLFLPSHFPSKRSYPVLPSVCEGK